MPTVPPHVRPISFASIELLLDLIYSARQVFPDVDMEELIILLCVADATTRPFMLNEKTPQDVLLARKPPEEVRGSISRRLVSDKTGLPRETVRRKVAALAERGLLFLDEEGRVRIFYGLADGSTWSAVEEGHEAVLRYLARLQQFGVDPQMVVRSFGKGQKRGGSR